MLSGKVDQDQDQDQERLGMLLGRCMEDKEGKERMCRSYGGGGSGVCVDVGDDIGRGRRVGG